MKKLITRTPEGTRDYLYGQCSIRAEISKKLIAIFEKRGYSEVITPMIEYYDSIAGGNNGIKQESMYKLCDFKGRILVIRPDCTLPIARVAAAKLNKKDVPVRFFYNQRVLRAMTENSGRDAESLQCGIELLGATGPKADLEVLVCAIDSLISLGRDDFKIELSHAGLISSLISDIPFSEEEQGRVYECIENKNFAALNDVLSQYTEYPSCEAILRLPGFFGTGEVLTLAKKVIKKKKAAEILEYLEELLSLLAKMGYGKYVSVDLGLVQPIEYYTGIVFNGYLSGVGTTVITGGRYDSLIGSFGLDMPAVGFAADVDTISNCLFNEDNIKQTPIIHYEIIDLLTAIKAAEELSGELSPFDNIKDTIALAKSRGLSEIYVIKDGKTQKREV